MEELPKIKICNKCRRKLDISNFYRTKERGRNKEIVRAIYKECWSERNWKHYERQKQERQNPDFRAKYIVKDAAATDKKRGYENDLDIKWVDNAILKGCVYCGETMLRMTLDRIDNDKGHVKDNVVPACIRCNFVRGTMPYEAWLIVAPGMRLAREQGCFKDWTGAINPKGRTRIRIGIKKSKPRFTYKY